MRHQLLFSSTEGKGVRRSMSIASLMPWDHMLVIIISDLENFRRVSPIVLTHGTRRWHQDLFTLGKAWQAGFVRNISSMRNESLPLNSTTPNIGISQFSRLLEAVRRTSMSVKPAGQRTWRNEKKEAHQTLAIDDKPSNDYNSRKRKDRETYPPLPCKDEEFHAILDTMIADGVIKPVRPYKVPTREEKNDPRYCRYHQFGQINDVFIRRALVDTGSSVNILPLSVLAAAGIPLSKIVQSQTSISGFGNKSEVTVGHVQVNLKVGPIRSLTKFYVVDVDVAYHALLGRPWLNKHKLVVSTYHQCVKGRIGLRPLRIPGNQAPFNKDEAHYSEAEFYTEYTGAGSNPSKDFGTYLHSWTEIRD
ncbi:unnamed protein product, partial [Prunus brigantina]